MANEPDPPESWRVYEGDSTPDPEPPAEPPADPPPVPYGDTPIVPYGGAQSYSPTIIVHSSGSGVVAKLILVVVAMIVLGGGVAAAIAIFAAVDGGIDSIGGIDAKDPDDFEELVDQLEEERGSTEVFWVGLYTDYIIVDVPYTDDPNDTRELNYNWRGGDLDDNYSKGTSSDARFDLKDIDPALIDGMCDPLLDLADGATLDDCYIFISKPTEAAGAWFYTSASDEFGRSYSIQYNKVGKEINRNVPQ